MTNFPRIDQVEKTIEEAIKNKKLITGLTKQLIKELNNLDLFFNIIESRIRCILVAFKKCDSQENYEFDAINSGEEYDEWLETLSREWFSNHIDRYYLERRETLERVSFQLFRTPSKGIANEAHQRLIEGEESWETIIDRWGLEQDKINGGLFIGAKPNKIGAEITNMLRRLKKGEISEPFRCGRNIIIARLIEWKRVELDEELKRNLEVEMLENWVQERSIEATNKFTDQEE